MQEFSSIDFSIDVRFTFSRVEDLAISSEIYQSQLQTMVANRSPLHNFKGPTSIDVYMLYRDLEAFHLKSMEVKVGKL